MATARVIAFYLPQFHPIPENDEWWGKGFTEWTNTAKAKPLYAGHYQPHIPADLGFYDLRVPETREAQAEMARQNGIEAFCYYHYWFAGKRIIQRPFEEVLRSGKPEFPFCLCWANQTWTGIWHGAPNRILIEQTYPGEEDYENHLQALLPAFRDPRYVRVDDKPMLLIYRPLEIPNLRSVARFLRRRAVEEGLPGLYLVGVKHDDQWVPQQDEFDAAVMQKLPRKIRHVPWKYPLLKLRRWLNKSDLTIYSYKDVANSLIRTGETTYIEYPCVIPNWDNSPRSGMNSLILDGSTPELFRRQLKKAIARVATLPYGERFVFLKAWNEWAEGNYVEPDALWGHDFLHVIRQEILGDHPE